MPQQCFLRNRGGFLHYLCHQLQPDPGNHAYLRDDQDTDGKKGDTGSEPGDVGHRDCRPPSLEHCMRVSPVSGGGAKRKPDICSVSVYGPLVDGPEVFFLKTKQIICLSVKGAFPYGMCLFDVSFFIYQHSDMDAAQTAYGGYIYVGEWDRDHILV